MTAAGSRRRPPVAARRAGYVVSLLVNGALLYIVNRSPGWDAVGFLTDATTRVVPLVNASIVVGLVVNVLYLLRDPPRLRSLGDLVMTAVGLAAVLRVWQVFPFDLTDGWELVVRILLGVATVGSVIGIVASVVSLLRNARSHPPGLASATP